MSTALCRWAGSGTEFRAEHIRTRPDGSYLMRSLQAGDRFAAGTKIVVHKREIVTWEDGGPGEITLGPDETLP